MANEFETFEQFWPFYVSEHASKLTRRMHFAGTTVAVLALSRLIRTRNPAWLPVALVAGYGPAWVSHFFVEHNKPASFKHPAWSLVADFKMAALMLAGEMDNEVERCRAQSSEAAAARAAASADGASDGATSNPLVN